MQSYRNGVHGEFFLSVAAELARLKEWAKNHVDEVDRLKEERDNLLSLERSYAHQLGEMSRLCDKVCDWARSRHADPPSDVWEAADEIMQYVDAVRPPEGSKAPEWVVHILGPDDVHDCVGEFDALRRANQHNKVFAKLMENDPTPNNPYCVALAKNRLAESI
jgi:hypothetical protein